MPSPMNVAPSVKPVWSLAQCEDATTETTSPNTRWTQLIHIGGWKKAALEIRPRRRVTPNNPVVMSTTPPIRRNRFGVMSRRLMAMVSNTSVLRSFVLRAGCRLGIYRSLLQQALQSSSIEADDDFVVNADDGRREISKSGKLIHRLFVFGYVAFDEWNAALGKKLFHLGTEQSAGLGIYDHVLRHLCPPEDRISTLDHG